VIDSALRKAYRKYDRSSRLKVSCDDTFLGNFCHSHTKGFKSCARICARTRRILLTIREPRRPHTKKPFFLRKKRVPLLKRKRCLKSMFRKSLSLARPPISLPLSSIRQSKSHDARNTRPLEALYLVRIQAGSHVHPNAFGVTWPGPHHRPREAKSLSRALAAKIALNHSPADGLYSLTAGSHGYGSKPRFLGIIESRWTIKGRRVSSAEPGRRLLKKPWIERSGEPGCPEAHPGLKH